MADLPVESIAWAVEESEPIRPAWVRPPDPAEDVCSLCHGWTRPGYDVCFACRLILSQVSRPCRQVRVMSMYRPGSAMHLLLRGYKDGPAAHREAMASRVAALASRFIWQHGPRTAPGGWDAVAVVPSTSRAGPHPLETALGRSAWLAPQVWSGCLGPGPAAAACRHRRASDDAFGLQPGRDVSGAAVLLVEDTWTTGARAQSAASALNRAGAEVVGLMVLGRVITPVAGAPTGRWWDRHARRGPGRVAGVGP